MIKKKIYFKVLIFILSIFFSKNFALAQINYSEKVKSVAERAVDMTYIYTPIGYKDFEVIYIRPEKYLDSAIQYLSRPNYKELEFSVVSLSMHRLRPEKYLTFVEKCFEIYYERKIDDNIMFLVLFGRFGNPIIRDNHTDYRVQALLKKLIENEKTTKNIKNYAIKLMDGKVPKSYEGPNPDIIKNVEN